jgi:hypothetical protein
MTVGMRRGSIDRNGAQICLGSVCADSWEEASAKVALAVTGGNMSARTINLVHHCVG